MKTSATLQFIFENVKKAEAALIALSHEEDFKKRSISKVIRKDSMLLLNIESDDVIALRAALNAYLRDIQVFEGVEKIDKKEFE